MKLDSNAIIWERYSVKSLSTNQQTLIQYLLCEKKLCPGSVMEAGGDGNIKVIKTISFYKEMTVSLEELVNGL